MNHFEAEQFVNKNKTRRAMFYQYEGDEHQLTCRDLYRIRKMCNIGDIE